MKQNRTEKVLSKAQDMWYNTLQNITPLPEPDDRGKVTISYKELCKLLNQRRKLSWSEGVFDAIATVI